MQYSKKDVYHHGEYKKGLNAVVARDARGNETVKKTLTGDTVCDEKFPIILESMKFPEPVISVAVEPKTKNDAEKLSLSCSELKNYFCVNS